MFKVEVRNKTVHTASNIKHAVSRHLKKAVCLNNELFWRDNNVRGLR